MLGKSSHPVWSWYTPWAQRRLAVIIDHYGAFFFAGKKVVDLGAGHGGIGGGLAHLGAKVTFVDGREEHINILRAHYPDCPAVSVNLDTDWPTGDFDLALFMGCLYHLDNPVRAIEHCARYSFLVLETEVLDTEDPEAKPEAIGEGPGSDQGIGETQGKHPPVLWVERELSRNGIFFERYIGSSANAGMHPYDWQPSNVGHKTGRRALWFCRGPLEG